MAEIDVLLSASLKRSAQPGDAAGVADAIRSRVAAGDTGAPAASSGFGGAKVLSWLPWVGLVILAGIGGGAAGAAGVFAPEPIAVALPNPPAAVSMAPTYSCPGGEIVGSVVAGSRVLALQRSADDAFLAVRDPWNHSSTVWVSRADVAVDADQDAASIPVGACPVITLSAPVVVPPPPVEPEDDTTAPTTSASAKPAVITIEGYSAYCGPDISTITVVATDNVGVTEVWATWAGGRDAFTASGDVWSLQFSEPVDAIYDLTILARDAAGNVSDPSYVTIVVEYCLI